MKETKLSLLRSFGTEQFSITVTLPEFSKQQDVNDSIDMLNATVFKMMQDTEMRGIQEREVLAKSSQARASSIEKLNTELKAETESKKKLADSVKVAEKNFNKLNK